LGDVHERNTRNYGDGLVAEKEQNHRGGVAHRMRAQ
jgi:hypothetical protein